MMGNVYGKLSQKNVKKNPLTMKGGGCGCGCVQQTESNHISPFQKGSIIKKKLKKKLNK